MNRDLAKKLRDILGIASANSQFKLEQQTIHKERLQKELESLEGKIRATRLKIDELNQIWLTLKSYE